MRRVTGWGAGAALLLCGVTVGSAPADEVERRIEVFRSGGAHLGVQLTDVKADDLERLKLGQERGALVVGVEPDSPAATAGVEKDDVILRFQGEAVRSAAQLARLVRETPAGRSVTLEVSRDGAARELSATLGNSKMSGFWFGDAVAEMPLPPTPPEPPDLPQVLERELKLLHAPRVESLRRPRTLGIEYLEISDQLAGYFRLGEDRGVLVSSVIADGAAGKAGMKAGDVILDVGGRDVKDGRDLRRALARVESGELVKIKVQRDGRPLELEVKLSSAGRRRSRTST